MGKRILKPASTVLALFLTIFFLSSPLFAATLRVQSQDRGGEFVPGELLVKFRGEKRSRVVKLPRGKLVERAQKEFERESHVEYAEPNYIAHALFIPDDPYYSYQWHFDNPVYGGIHAESAWEVSRGSGVTVAIIDTGIAYENYRRWWSRYYQAPDLAETCFVSGYDFVENDSHPNDDNGHGTHVAGTVAQSTNNGLGVAGVAFESCLMPIKVLNRNGSGTYADVAEGIRFAADKGAQVINLSLGGSASSQTLLDAVAYAHSKGVTIVAAAGNDSAGAVSYPAAYDDYVLAVGATRYDETLAYYSNHGPSLDLVAPGGDLNVDQNGDGYGDGVLQQTFGSRNNDWGYYFYQGTSMAAPHVSGVAAMVIANGVSNPDSVRAALEGSAEDLGPLGWDETYGWGLLDAATALGYVPGPIDNPPAVNIVSPSDDETVIGSVDIVASASDDFGVDRVDFYVDDALIGSDTTDPYEISWNSTVVSDGSHTVTASAVDTTSQTGSDSINVVVDNVNDPPIAEAGPDQAVLVDEVVTFDGSLSHDPDGTIVSYAWDFGDGEGGNNATATHAYPTAGTYTVTLRVTDDGGLQDQDTLKVTVSEAPAVEEFAFTGTVPSQGENKHLVSVKAGAEKMYVKLTWSGWGDLRLRIYNPSGVLVKEVDKSTWGNRVEETTILTPTQGAWRVAVYSDNRWGSTSYTIKGTISY